MGAPITEIKVKKAVISWLRRQGYSNIHKAHPLGVDVKARNKKYSRFFFIEAKGDSPRKVKNPDAGRTSKFRTALGQIVTRMKTKSRDYYAIALPETFVRKVKNISWIFCKRNNLSIILVDDKMKVRQLIWRNLQKGNYLK